MPPSGNRQAVHIVYQPKVDITRECLSVRPEEIEAIDPGLGAISRVCLHYLKDLPMPCTGSAAARGLQNCCEEVLKLISITKKKLYSTTTDMKRELSYLRKVTADWTKYFKSPNETPGNIYSELEELRSENENLKEEIALLRGESEIFRKQAIKQINRYASASGAKGVVHCSNSSNEIEILENSVPEYTVPIVKMLPATSVRASVRVVARPIKTSLIKTIPLRPSEDEIQIRRVEISDSVRNNLFLRHLEEP